MTGDFQPENEVTQLKVGQTELAQGKGMGVGIAFYNIFGNFINGIGVEPEWARAVAERLNRGADLADAYNRKKAEEEG